MAGDSRARNAAPGAGETAAGGESGGVSGRTATGGLRSAVFQPASISRFGFTQYRISPAQSEEKIDITGQLVAIKDPQESEISRSSYGHLNGHSSDGRYVTVPSPEADCHNRGHHHRASGQRRHQHP